MIAPRSTLRSSQWFDRNDEMGMRHHGVLRPLGYDSTDVTGKPIIGICNPRSELNACELGFDELTIAIKRGVVAAGGVPLEFATMTLGADLCKPADMLYRNLVSMDVEETLRSYPIDGVVLLCNCDKTTPAQLMGVASANLPAIQFSGGPKATGYWRGKPFGSGTDLWSAWDEYRAGKITDDDWKQATKCISCSQGACNEMGTNSTMTSISEALGMMPAGTSTIPANDSQRMAEAQAAGTRIVQMVHEDLRPSHILTQQAFQNAIRVCMALGGSTNAVIHLTAIAGRRGIELPMSLFNKIAKETPLLVNLKPSGQYLLEHFHNAGGVPALLKQIDSMLHRDCVTVSGTIGQTVDAAVCHNTEVIRCKDNPMRTDKTLACLSGNLIPNGAVLKISAASSSLLQHTGPAVVFENYEDMQSRIDRDDLDVTSDSVLVMRNIGPRGVPGIPEWGSIPIPAKMLKQDVRDMVRISDGRMSGTGYGTVILHAAPEAAVGGPLAIVQTGDLIRLDAKQLRLDILINDDELQHRLAQWTPPPQKHLRGYPRLYADHVLQVDQGCDFDFLRPTSVESLKFVEPLVGRS